MTQAAANDFAHIIGVDQLSRHDSVMIAIRAIFDGKAFVPDQPISLPAKSEAIVIVEQSDPSSSAVQELDIAVRAYFESVRGSDADDDAWGKTTSCYDIP